MLTRQKQIVAFYVDLASKNIEDAEEQTCAHFDLTLSALMYLLEEDLLQEMTVCSTPN